jgi:transposase
MLVKGYRPHHPPQPMLQGYDPLVCLPPTHLAWLIEEVVEAAIAAPPRGAALVGPGQPEYDPRLLVKVLVYGYATGLRSSRRLSQLCRESLPYLMLTRGDAPCYHTLSEARRTHRQLIELVWVALFTSAEAAGLKRIGHIVVDSMKLPANLSPEMVLKEAEYEPMLAAVREALAEAEAQDIQEETEQEPRPSTPPRAMRRQLRDIVRGVRRRLEGREPQTPKPLLTRRMRRQLEKAESACGRVEAEEAGQEHLCLTDPEARFMYGGRGRQLRPAYSVEVAVDKEAGLTVAHGLSPEGNDNARLVPLVEAAKPQEPNGVSAVDADSGYYRSDLVRTVMEEGVDVCVPDSYTAGALRRGDPLGRRGVPIEYDEAQDCYRCPEGNVLVLWRRREIKKHPGEAVVEYQAQRSCRECPRQPECFRRQEPKGDSKLVSRREHGEGLREGQQRFAQEAYRERYRQRGSVVEGVFGYWRGALGYGRWLLRGREKVQCEEGLMALAYQLRRVYSAWAKGRLPVPSG